VPTNKPETLTSFSVSEDSVAQIAASLDTEQKEKRQMNVIIHNLEEFNATDGPARKQDDIMKCLSVFQTHLGLSISIANAF